MAHAYVSPPRSPTSLNPQSAPNPVAPTSAEALVVALSQPPPPTLREILSAYAAQGRGDRDMLIALLKAKAAEDQRITSIAQLQQQVLQAQMTALGAQVQQQNLSQPAADPLPAKDAEKKTAESTRDDRRSPVSPTPPKRYRSRTPVHVRAHPYSHSRTSSREDKSFWAVTGRGLNGNVSDERSTSDETATATDR